MWRRNLSHVPEENVGDGALGLSLLQDFDARLCEGLGGEERGFVSPWGEFGQKEQRGFTHQAAPSKIRHAIVGNRVRYPWHEGQGCLTWLLDLGGEKVGSSVPGKEDVDRGTLVFQD